MEKKVWYLTGASKGLGLALIKKLLAGGHRVAAASPFLSILVDEVSKTPDAGFLPLEFDPADESSVTNSIRTTWETFGHIDTVVNNAGYGAADPSDTATVIRNILPWLREQGSGHIINISLAEHPADIGPREYAADIGLREYSADIELPELPGQQAQYPDIHLTNVVRGAFHSQFPAEKDQARAMTIPIDGKQIGDPGKAAAALMEIAGLPEPPHVLFLASNAHHLVTEKMATLAAYINGHPDVSKSNGPVCRSHLIH
jgi:NAD(P)-dependent dehydrogenase (short-subunit alcohol dehydrogenase family)